MELGGVEEDEEVVGILGFLWRCGRDSEFFVCVCKEKVWVFCVIDSNMMYFYVLNFVFMFFNFVKIIKINF